MPDFGIYAGDTNKTIYVRLRDSTTGLAKTGLVYNSAGAVCSYTLPLAARAAITLATQTVTGAHTDGGFVEVDATNCKGLYRLDLSDAAIASGDYTIISIEFDGVIEESIHIPLHTRDVNVVQWLGTACATPTVAGVPEVDLTHVAGATTNVSALATNVDAILTDTADMQPKLGTVTDLGGGATLGANNSDMAGATFATATDSQEAIRNHVGDGTNLTEAGGNGDHLTEAGGTGDHLTAVAWNAAWDAEVESEVNDAIDTAISELGVAAPTATPTIRTALMLMYMALRNKLVVQTSGTDALEIYNDAGTKICSKALTDDGSDYTEAEMA